MTTDTTYDDAGFVVASRYRVAVLRRLAASPATPSTIAADTGFAIAHVSRALGKFRDRGLAELLVAEDRKKGRIYGLTDGGEACVGTLADMGVEA